MFFIVVIEGEMELLFSVISFYLDFISTCLSNRCVQISCCS